MSYLPILKSKQQQSIIINKLMIPVAEYEKYHNNQLKSLFDKGFYHELMLGPSQHKLYYPALLKHKYYENVIAQLEVKVNLKAPEICWLIISKAMLEENYLVHKAKLQEKFGQKWIQFIDKWLQSQQLLPGTQAIQKPIITAKSQMRTHFEMLNQRAVKYQYFNIKEVPTYLISTSWLQKFYDSTYEGHIPPVDNRHLVKPMPFVDTDYKFLHLNYDIKEHILQNKDYKIVSPQSWQFIVKKFDGFEVKRFTTIEKDPTVQIQYRKLELSILEDRYFHTTNLTILTPRFTKFKTLLERIKRMLIAYNIVPFQVLKRTMQIIKVNELSQKQLIQLIQDEEVQLIQEADERFEKIELQFDVEQAKIYSTKQQMVINFLNEKEIQKDFFSKVKSLQTIITRDSCISCGSSDDVFLCICKSAHFCSVSCQKSHKEHAKQCQKIRRQEIQITKLIKDYEITQSQLQLTNEHILSEGKVGLQNLRNTCYLNSALQCIMRVDELVKYFANNDHLKDLNVDNVLGSEGHLACAFGQLVKKYYTTRKRAISPIDVIRIIAKNPQFRGSDHQDSQQFLNYFLDKLHEDLNTIKKKPYLDEIESNGRSDQIVSAESWANYLKRNRSFIQELFSGQYRSQIRCPDCQRISITFDPFMSVTLQFPRDDRSQREFNIKGYILKLQGSYEKVELDLPPNTITRDFYAKTFKQNVIGVCVLKKLVRKQYREDLPIFKNYSDDGTTLFYIKEEGWERQINLQFLDKRKQLTAFNRRLYVKKQQSLDQLKRTIYLRLRVPLETALGAQFETSEQFIDYCLEKQILVFLSPKQQELQLLLSQTQPLTLKLQFNPSVKFKQQPKLNVSKTSYQTVSAIPIQKPKDYAKYGISVPEMIQNFNKFQKLTEDNMWYCSNCKDHKMADKIMKLYKLPQILVIHLKRFNHKSTRYRNLIGVEKIETSVNLKDKETINGVEYELFGVVNHFGSMTFGHYIAYVKKNDWVTYDDEKVKKCNVNGDNAYLLFYKRCNQSVSK